MKRLLAIALLLTITACAPCVGGDKHPRYHLDEQKSDVLTSPFLRNIGEGRSTADRFRQLDRVTSRYHAFYRFGNRLPGHYRSSRYSWGGYSYGGPWYFPGSPTNTNARWNSSARWRSMNW